MPRRKNKIETKTLTVATTPRVHAQLEALVQTGYFGKSAPEAAERILAETLREMEVEGQLSRLAAGGAKPDE